MFPAILRLTAAVYKKVPIPDGLTDDTEKEAVEFLFGIMKEHRFRFYVNYPELLSVYLEPGEKICFSYFMLIENSDYGKAMKYESGEI